jgi:hypothetical protein
MPDQDTSNVYLPANNKASLGLFKKFPHMRSFKGIVQRNLTGVETRLKKSALLSHYTAQVPFLILKGHHCERSIKPVSAS